MAKIPVLFACFFQLPVRMEYNRVAFVHNVKVVGRLLLKISGLDLLQAFTEYPTTSDPRLSTLYLPRQRERAWVQVEYIVSQCIV